MAQSKVTLIGMERYLNPDRSVFDNMVLPDGIDKDILVGTILLRCQEFELLFSDPDFMTAAVNVWSRKHYWTFDRWVKVLNEEYDPLWNKDYHETWKDTHEGEYSKEGSDSASGNTSQTNNLLETDDHTTTNNLLETSDHSTINDLTDTNDTTVTHSEKAYNSSGMVSTTEDVTDQDQTHTGSVRNAGTTADTGTVRNAGTTANTGTVTGTFGNRSNNDESGDDSYTNEHTYHGWGNIGITSAQQLLQAELDVATWNMYEHISDLFASEFCIMIY